MRGDRVAIAMKEKGATGEVCFPEHVKIRKSGFGMLAFRAFLGDVQAEI